MSTNKYGPRARKWAVWYSRQPRRPRPAHYFRVHTSRHARVFLHVEVYTTRQQLIAASRFDRCGVTTSSKLSAQCVEIIVRGTRDKRLRPDFAVVRLTAQSRSGDITHEAFHATLRWAARQGMDQIALSWSGGQPNRPRLVDVTEERLALVNETINIGLINGMYNCGYLRD